VDVIESLGNITAEEAKENVTYKELMYKNLKKLSKALMCN
jgi:zinc transport system substrate-binding protein